MPTKKKRIPISLDDEQYALVQKIAETLDQSLAQTMLDIIGPVLEQANFLNEQMREVKKTRKALDKFEDKLVKDIDSLKGEALALTQQARLSLNNEEDSR